MMDPRYDPHGAGGRVGGPWSPQPGGYGHSPGEEGANDALVRLGSWMLVGVATTLLAAAALVTGDVLYGVATWRRWPSWPVALAGGAGLLAVLVVSGPTDALDRHLPGRPQRGPLPPPRRRLRRQRGAGGEGRSVTRGAGPLVGPPSATVMRFEMVGPGDPALGRPGGDEGASVGAPEEDDRGVGSAALSEDEAGSPKDDSARAGRSPYAQGL
jgi:hypothetical protein